MSSLSRRYTQLLVTSKLLFSLPYHVCDIIQLTKLDPVILVECDACTVWLCLKALRIQIRIDYDYCVFYLASSDLISMFNLGALP
jgi:hypothetical protein